MHKFVHLHTHSHYSLLDGLAKIDRLLARTQELKMEAVALTDHGVMYGVIDFYTKAKEAGVKPIIGCEIYIAPRKLTDKTAELDRDPYHLVLLAKDNEGYKNLIKIVSHAHLEGFYYKPRTDKEFLKSHSKGLIALTACMGGEVPRKILNNDMQGAIEAANWYQETFGKDNFYLELQYHPELPEQEIVNKGLLEVAKKTGIPGVASQDVHYAEPEDSEAQDLLLCIQTGKTVNDEKRMKMETDNSMASTEEMYKHFEQHSELLENTVKIAERCNVEIELGKNILPDFDVPENKTPDQFLRELCENAIPEKYGKKPDKEIIERLDYELSIIEKTGYATYFLIVSDFIVWAKNQDILIGPGRGSAAGSIVSYLLKITNVDPIKYQLVFERFLNPERVSMPDIDIDIQDNRRAEVIKYVSDKYGADHVAQIITFGTMAARNAIRDVVRVLGFPYAFGDKLAKLVPLGFNLEEAEKVPEMKTEIGASNDAKKVYELAKRLEGVARHASTHAAGVVISKEPLTEYVPLQRATKGEDAIVTQYSMYDVEKIGLLKMDFLGLSNLSILGDALEIVEAVHGKKIELDKIPLDDKTTYKLLAAANTTGVFQLESGGMKRYLKELKPTVFEDIVSMVALYRPGPMDAIPDFIAGKHGTRSIYYLHPTLKEILQVTYGVIVTQDQVLEIARKFAGMTYSEADILRKAVGKKIKKLLDEQKEKFITGAINHSKVDKKLATDVWNFIEPFARYGFNRAHAVCYALIAYQTAYLKSHYPASFMAALMTSNKGDIEKVAIEIKEANRMKIEVLAPDVNESFSGFAVVPETGNIRYALSAIKNVGEGVSEKIVAERKENGKYKSLEDFLSRSDSSVTNKKALESLIKAGALDGLENREAMIANLTRILEVTASFKKISGGNQMDLFGGEKPVMHKFELTEKSTVTRGEQLKFEKELIGLYLSGHPLEEHKKFLEKNATALSEIKNMKNEDKVRVGGIVTGIHKILTKKGENMYFVTIEDYDSALEVIVFPRVLERDHAVWTVDNIIFVDGKVSSNKDDEPKVIVEDVIDIKSPYFNQFLKKENGGKVIKRTKSLNLENGEQKLAGENSLRIVELKLPNHLNIGQLKDIQLLLKKYKGEKELILNFDGKKMKLPFGVEWGEDLKSQVKEIVAKK